MLKLLLVVIIVAVATYLLIRVIERRGVTTPLPTRTRSKRPAGPLGPDDDDEFLRELDRKRLHPDDPDS